MRRPTLHSIIRFLMRILTDTEYRNLEYLPVSGPVIIATNHLSRMDIPLLFVTPSRNDVTALVTTKYKSYPIIRWFSDTAEAIWLDRETADFAAFRSAAAELKKGKAMGISPEGTRSETGGLLPGKPGTVLLALRTGAPIIPVGLTGTETASARLLRLGHPKMVATFGETFEIPPIGKETREEDLQRATDEVMCRIAACLPPEYRGVYADHSRLKEILAAQGGEVKIISSRKL